MIGSIAGITLAVSMLVGLYVSYAAPQKKEHPGNPAPPPRAPAPTVHAPPPRAPAPAVHAPPPRAPVPTVHAPVHQAPVMHAPSLQAPIVHAPAPQAPAVHAPAPQAPTTMPTLQLPSPITTPSPIQPSPNVGAPSPQPLMPQVPPFSRSTGPTTRGVFPSITTSKGTTFKPWATLPSPNDTQTPPPPPSHRLGSEVPQGPVVQTPAPQTPQVGTQPPPPFHRLGREAPQGTINTPTSQTPATTQTLQGPSNTSAPSPSQPSMNVGAQNPQSITPQGQSLSGPTRALTGGTVPSITTSGGDTFNPRVNRQRFFQGSGQRNSGRRDFFRNNFQQNFSSAFWFIPAVVAPYYPDTSYYPDIYYPGPFYPDSYYQEPYYPEPYYTQQPHALEEPYYSDEPEYIDLSPYINHNPYPEYDYTKQEFYPQDQSGVYPNPVTSPDQQISLEMQQLETLLQSVLQSMKIFDVPEFYNNPEFSIFSSKGSS